MIQQIIVGRFNPLQAMGQRAVRHKYIGVLAIKTIDGVDKGEVIDPFVGPQEVKCRGADVIERRLIAMEEVANVGLALKCSHRCTCSSYYTKALPCQALRRARSL